MRKIILIALILGLAALSYVILYSGVENNQKMDDASPQEVIPEAITEDWIYSSTTDQGLQFAYPPEPGNKFVIAENWPPALELMSGDLICSEEEQQLIIAGETYCRKITSEGAAGSAYRSYTYRANQGDFTPALSFAFRFPRCGNYSLLQRSNCETKQAEFNSGKPDALAAGIFASIQMR